MYYREGCLTPPPPDRLRRGSARAIGKVSCYDEFGVLHGTAAGEPNRCAA